MLSNEKNKAGHLYHIRQVSIILLKLSLDSSAGKMRTGVKIISSQTDK